MSPEFDARETIGILREEASSRETRPEAWAFLKTNFDRIVARLPRESPARFPMLAAGFSDRQKRAEVEEFFKDKAPKYMGGPRYLAQTLEQIQLRAAFKVGTAGERERLPAKVRAEADARPQAAVGDVAVRTPASRGPQAAAPTVFQ